MLYKLFHFVSCLAVVVVSLFALQSKLRDKACTAASMAFHCCRHTAAGDDTVYILISNMWATIQLLWYMHCTHG